METLTEEDELNQEDESERMEDERINNSDQEAKKRLEELGVPF